MSIVPEAVVEQGVAELRESGELDESQWELFTDTERGGHSFARGHREGREEGLEEGRKEGLEEGRKEGLEEGRKEGLEEGRKEGLEEGRCQTLRRALLDILELRGFELTAATRERVESCASIEQLERWYAAGKSASNQSVDQVLDG